MTNDHTAKLMARHRMIEGARRHAAADRTDPFSFRRSMAHIDNGVASVTRRESNRDFDMAGATQAFYDASEQRVIAKVEAGERTLEAERVIYTSVVRP